MKIVFALLLVSSAFEVAVAQTEEAVREAREFMFDGDHRAVVEHLQAEDTLSAQGYYLLGRAYQSLLRHERAVEALERADTTDRRVLAALGRSLNQLGRTGAAETRYRQAYRQDSTDQQVATRLAKLYANAGKWGEVKAIYARLLGEDPDNSFLHAQLGTAYVAMDSTDEAIAHYERAHRLNLGNVKVVIQLSNVYFGIEHYISARRVVDRALKQHPRHPRLWQRRGDVALKEEDYEVATKSFRNALAYGDSTALNLRNLGISLYLEGDPEASLEPLTRSYEADSTDVMNAFYLGMAHKQQQHFDQALFFLRHTTDLMQQQMLADVHAQIANAYDQMDETGEAIQSYRLALNLNPEKTEVLFHLAALYDEYYADPSVALEHYRRFLTDVEEEQLPQMQSYARQRVSEITEQEFFEEGRTPSPVAPPSDTASGLR